MKERENSHFTHTRVEEKSGSAGLHRAVCLISSSHVGEWVGASLRDSLQFKFIHTSIPPALELLIHRLLLQLSCLLSRDAVAPVLGYMSKFFVLSEPHLLENLEL